MEKTDWADVRNRLKKAIDQSMKVLKEGSKGAAYVAAQTAHVLQLELEIHRLKSRIATLMHRLGEETYRASGNGHARVTPEMKKLTADLDFLKDSLRKREGEVKRTHLTRTAKRGSKK